MIGATAVKKSKGRKSEVIRKSRLLFFCPKESKTESSLTKSVWCEYGISGGELEKGGRGTMKIIIGLAVIVGAVAFVVVVLLFVSLRPLSQYFCNTNRED